MSHAIDRARERYGIELTLGDLSAMADQIETGAAVLKERHPDADTERWIVKIRGRALVVAYRPATRWIVTVLPPTNVARKRWNPRRHPRGKRPPPPISD